MNENELLNRYAEVNDKLMMLSACCVNYDFDDCAFDIEGYHDHGVNDEGVLLDRVEALEELVKAIDRVHNTEIIYA
jgi:hypothetical protein